MVARPLGIVQMLSGLEGGGVERGTLEMGAYLSRRGHRSLVISGGGRLVPPLIAGGSRHLQWRVGEKSPRALAYVLPLRRLLDTQRVDVLHLRSRLPAWIGYLAWRSLPIRRRPLLVTTFHGFYSVNLYSAIMARGQRVIAISRTIADHVQQCYGVPSGRIELIYRGFDAGSFTPARVAPGRIERIRRHWNFADPAAPVVMLPGRMTRLKGHTLFLRSLARVRHLSWNAVCVGDTRENSAYVDELRRLLYTLDLTERVCLAGYCTDMPAALLAADIVVSANTSKPEAFGRIAVEAQAMERPVIASALGGSRETVRHHETGWLVPPDDAERLAQALAEALGDADRRRRYGALGRRWVGRQFTTQNMCRQTLQLYETMLSRPPKAR